MANKIRRLGEYADLTEWFSKKDRVSLEDHRKTEILEDALRDVWNLGRNTVMNWARVEGGMQVLAVPYYVIAGYLGTSGDEPTTSAALTDQLLEILSGPMEVRLDVLEDRATALAFDTEFIPLPDTHDWDTAGDLISNVVKRFGVNYHPDRAVALFDIVGFSLYSPTLQVSQLNSLTYSFNVAHARMLNKAKDIDFVRSTTGDGFYVWSRDNSIEANINLYQYMNLVLADNAIARIKSKGIVAPLLRAAFHVGSHYEFYHSEGLNPSPYSYIVGDVTIELARLIEHALPGQILVGDFKVPMFDREAGEAERVDSIRFIELTHETLSDLEGILLSGEPVDAIRCYLTGERQPGGDFAITKYVIKDKHDMAHHAYNAKINIYRENAFPIYLGIQRGELESFAPEEQQVREE